MNATASIIHRTCACGCGRQFNVDPHRPGRQYLYGHKPRPTHAPASPQVVGPKAKQNEERQLLDYRLARRTADHELQRLDSQIDAVDDELEDLRLQVAAAEVRKDRLVARHLRVRKASLYLTGAIEDVDAADE